jgi:hypothetical protein
VISATYEELVRTFGEPGCGDGYKTRVEWDIQFADGTLASVYDWKSPEDEVEDVEDWNVGGFSVMAVRSVEAALDVIIVDELVHLLEGLD